LLQYKKSVLIFISTFLLLASFQTWIIYSTGYPFSQSLADSVISTLLLSTICYSLSFILSHYTPSKTRAFSLLVWVLVLSLLNTGILNLIIPVVFGSAPAYLTFFSDTLPLRLFYAFLIFGGFILLNWTWSNIQQEQAELNRSAEIEKLAKHAELYSLRQQLQPHFLFNTLNSINALISIRPEEAKKMIMQLSDFLRTTLKKDDEAMTTLSSELEHLQLYLDIEKVRFGHRLKIETKIDKETENLKLPSLLLQPLVENAVKFGLYDLTDEVIIRLETSKAEDNLLVFISNPFDPETSGSRSGTGFGLNSIKRRLYLIYGRNDLLETEIQNQTFSARVKIPQLK